MKEQNILRTVYAVGYRIDALQFVPLDDDGEWRVLIEAKGNKKLKGEAQDANITVALLKALVEIMMLELADLRLAAKRRESQGNEHKPGCKAEDVTAGGGQDHVTN